MFVFYYSCIRVAGGWLSFSLSLHGQVWKEKKKKEIDASITDRYAALLSSVSLSLSFFQRTFHEDGEKRSQELKNNISFLYFFLSFYAVAQISKVVEELFSFFFLFPFPAVVSPSAAIERVSKRLLGILFVLYKIPSFLSPAFHFLLLLRENAAGCECVCVCARSCCCSIPWLARDRTHAHTRTQKVFFCLYILRFLRAAPPCVALTGKKNRKGVRG